jgi:pimeloyl-ACP methyl ester carboxylesterase
VFGLLDHLGESAAVLGGVSLGANISLFAATSEPERVRGLVLEMPVLEWAVPVAALLFSPMVLLAHYGRPVLRLTSALMRRLPSTPFAPLNSVMAGAALPPDSMAALLHGILVGPVAPTVEQRSAIDVPALVLAHRNDLIHPFDDAHNLAHQLPNATLVPARSPLELRLRPDRLTDVIGSFVDEVQPPPPRAVGQDIPRAG